MIFNPSKPGDTLFFMGLPEEIRLMIGFTVLSAEQNPIEYSRRYADDADGTVEAVGFYPAVVCTFDLLRGDPVHGALSACFTDGVPSDYVFMLYNADVSGGGPEFPCRRRMYAFVPKSIRYGSGGSGLPAHSYIGTFFARGLPELGHAIISPDRGTLTFFGD